MSSTETTEMKKLKTRDQSSNIKEVTIEYLHDDCLLGIFQYLNVKEKIKLESVCQNFNRVIKMSWNRIRNLELHKILPHKFNPDQDSIVKRKNTRFVLNILERCGSSLYNIKISYQDINFLLSLSILNEIPKYCNNITCLDLSDGSVLPSFTDEHLKILFSKNPNISSIALEHFGIGGDCFSELNINNIKELKLDNCRFESPGQFYGFIANLKNLSTFHLINNLGNIIQVLHALIVGRCEKISEMFLRSLRLGAINNLSLFISKQTNLRNLTLSDVMIDQNFLNKLPRDKLEVFSLKFPDNLASNFVLNIPLFLINHKNIQKIELFNVPITDKPLNNQFKNCQESVFKELVLIFDDIESRGNQINLSVFLSKYQSIRKLQLHNVLIKEESIEDLICNSKTLVLEELNISFTNFSRQEINATTLLFLSKLKIIEKLRLKNIKIDENLMKNLPFESLTELDLDLRKNEKCDMLLKFLDQFQNLQALKLLFKELYDGYLFKLNKFLNENIKKLEIHFDDYSPSLMRIDNYKNLKKLVSFNFHNDTANSIPKIDYLLKDLSACKNLNYLSIDHCAFLSSALSSLSNLIKLKVMYADSDDYDIVQYIKNVKNIKEIQFVNCHNLTNNLIKDVSDVKVERGDTDELNILFDDCEEINLQELKDAPLVNVNYMDE